MRTRLVCGIWVTENGLHRGQRLVISHRSEQCTLPLAVALVAVSEYSLKRPLLLQRLLVELVQVGLLVAGLGLGLVDVGHLQQRDRAAVLHLEVVEHLLGVLVVRLPVALVLLLLALLGVHAAAVTVVVVGPGVGVHLLLVILHVGCVAVGVPVVLVLLALGPGAGHGVGPVWVPEVVQLQPDDGPGQLPHHPVEHPADQLEGGEQGRGRAPVVRVLKADGLVVVDLDLVEHVVLLEAVEDRAVDLAEELADVVGILGDDHEAVVVQHVALDGLVLTRQILASLGLTRNSCLDEISAMTTSTYRVPLPLAAGPIGGHVHELLGELVVVDLDPDHAGRRLLAARLLEDGVCGGDGGGPLVPDVEGDGEHEAVGVVEVVLHRALVPHLVSGLVVDLAEVSRARDVRTGSGLSLEDQLTGPWGCRGRRRPRPRRRTRPSPCAPPTWSARCGWPRRRGRYRTA